MLRLLMVLCVAAFAGVPLAEDAVEKLPQPHYRPQKSDPAWLKNAAQFHGHLGPMMVFGAGWVWPPCTPSMPRATSTWKSSVKGRWRNPRPRAFSTDCKSAPAPRWENETWSGSNGKKIVVYVKNTETGKTAVLQPTDMFLACCGSRRLMRRECPTPRSGNNPETTAIPTNYRGRSQQCPKGTSSPSVIPSSKATATPPLAVSAESHRRELCQRRTSMADHKSPKNRSPRQARSALGRAKHPTMT